MVHCKDFLFLMVQNFENVVNVHVHGISLFLQKACYECDILVILFFTELRCIQK